MEKELFDCNYWMTGMQILALIEAVEWCIQMHLVTWLPFPLPNSSPQKQHDFGHWLQCLVMPGNVDWLVNDSRRVDAVEVPRRKCSNPSSPSLELAMLFLICITDSWEHRLGWRSIFWDVCTENKNHTILHQS